MYLHVPACTCVSLRNFLKFVWLLSSYSARSRIKRREDYAKIIELCLFRRHCRSMRRWNGCLDKVPEERQSKSIDYAGSREYKCTHDPFQSISSLTQHSFTFCISLYIIHSAIIAIASLWLTYFDTQYSHSFEKNFQTFTSQQCLSELPCRL